MPHRVEPPAFSRWLCRRRDAVERFFNQLKHFRAVATRYGKRDGNDLVSVKLAPLRIWLRIYVSAAWSRRLYEALRDGIMPPASSDA